MKRGRFEHYFVMPLEQQAEDVEDSDDEGDTGLYYECELEMSRHTKKGIYSTLTCTITR